MSDYQFSDGEIKTTVEFLKYYHPAGATEENAVAYLDYIKFTVHEISKSDLTNTKLEELYEAFLKSKS